MKSIFDFIVVGAGSAGCAVAANLSESGKFSVLLIAFNGVIIRHITILCL